MTTHCLFTTIINIDFYFILISILLLQLSRKKNMKKKCKTKLAIVLYNPIHNPKVQA